MGLQKEENNLSYQPLDSGHSLIRFGKLGLGNVLDLTLVKDNCCKARIYFKVEEKVMKKREK